MGPINVLSATAEASSLGLWGPPRSPRHPSPGAKQMRPPGSFQQFRGPNILIWTSNSRGHLQKGSPICRNSHLVPCPIFLQRRPKSPLKDPPLYGNLPQPCGRLLPGASGSHRGTASCSRSGCSGAGRGQQKFSCKLGRKTLR